MWDGSESVVGSYRSVLLLAACLMGERSGELLVGEFASCMLDGGCGVEHDTTAATKANLTTTATTAAATATTTDITTTATPAAVLSATRMGRRARLRSREFAIGAFC